MDIDNSNLLEIKPVEINNSVINLESKIS